MTYKQCVSALVIFLLARSAFWQACAAQTLPGTEDGSTYRLGIEGFYDHYREPSLDVTENSKYGSLDGTYSYRVDEYFAAIDGRVSYGKDNYASPSGTENNIPQWEYELRGRAGLVLWDDGDNDVIAYAGLGERYFDDKNKGRLTSIGDTGYERRISQLYIPIGTTYIARIADGWTLSPTAEFDTLLWGNVNSRLGNNGSLCFYVAGCTATGVYPNNMQTSGYGLRGDLMLAQTLGTTASWEIGPFVRYWDIHQSENVTYPLSTAGYRAVIDEPTNTRLQAGVKLNILW